MVFFRFRLPYLPPFPASVFRDLLPPNATHDVDESRNLEYERQVAMDKIDGAAASRETSSTCSFVIRHWEEVGSGQLFSRKLGGGGSLGCSSA